MADIDPADQWVLDPESGTYVFRPDAPPALPPARPERAAPPGPAAGGPPRGGRRRHRAPRPARRWPARPADLAERWAAAVARRWRREGATRRGLLAWGAAVLGCVTLAAGVGGFLVYRHLNGNLRTVDVGDAGAKSVAAPSGPLTVLFIGTDSRIGLGRRYGDAGSVGHADTTVLLRVAPGGRAATALSIPRDLITDVPDCPTRGADGTVRVVPGLRAVRFNTSLGQQGRDPGCVMRTVAALTGIRPDHFLMADFGAVKDLSTAVGGVPVCLAKDIDDVGGSGLRLSRGRHVVEGEQALAFVRTRHSVGFGGDLDRIRLQQQFLASLLRTLRSGGTLTNPARLWEVAETATSALTVDTGIGSVARLADLARDLAGLDPDRVTFTTVPVLDNPAEHGARSTVVLDEPSAAQLFRLIASGGSLTPAPGRSPAPGPLAGTAVTVLNGAGVPGAAHAAVARLRDAGVTGAVVGGNAPASSAATTVGYGPGGAGRARALAALLGLPPTALRAADTGAGGTGAADTGAGGGLTLTVGTGDAAPARALPGAAVPTPQGLRVERASDRSVCAR